MRLNWIRSKARSLAGDEDGFTMIAVVTGIALVTALVGVSLAATNSDQGLLQRDIGQKRAYAAAQAGIADYTYHLNNDSGYWTRCTAVPTPNAVNQQGAISRYRPVDPTVPTGPQYAIELIPASGQSACDSNNPTVSMLESTGPNIGTFRIRSTGYSGTPGAAGTEKQSIVATYKQATFLDYVYFTQLETSDPVTYGYANPSAALTGAYSQCTKFRRDGRESSPIPGTNGRDFCDQIVFVDGDHIDGPLHTNDDLCIDTGDHPIFGRNAADLIEVSSPPRGYGSTSSGGCSASAATPTPGAFTTNAPVLTPPTTNGSLRTIAGPSYTYTGPDQDRPQRQHHVDQWGLVRPLPERRRCLRPERLRLHQRLLAVHGHLPEHVGLRKRGCAQQRQLLGTADDRRRERHHHRRQHHPVEQLQRPARPGRQQLRPDQAPGLSSQTTRAAPTGRSPRKRPRATATRTTTATGASMAPARCRIPRSTRRSWRSTTHSSSTTMTAAARWGR